MPKSDGLCKCAHKCIRCNVDDHQCECLPVLKEEGIKSWIWRHCVPAFCTLLKKQFKPGLTAKLINCNCLPQNCVSCTIKKDKPWTYWLVVYHQCNECHARTQATWTCQNSCRWVVKGSCIWWEQKIQCNWLPVHFFHIYHPQDPRWQSLLATLLGQWLQLETPQT